MRTSHSGLRLGVILLFLFGLLAPAMSQGAAAQGLTCEDFTSQRAAQRVLDADPDTEDALDEDGDGVACNEFFDTEGTATEEATEEDNGGSTGDSEFAQTISDELDGVETTFDRYDEIIAGFGDATNAEKKDLTAEIEDIAGGWADYPDTAADIEIPADAQDLGDAYLDFADQVGAAGETWQTWWDTPEGDAGEDAALDDFNTAYADARAGLEDMRTAVEDAGGSSQGGDDTPVADGDAAAYASAVQDQIDAFTDSSANFDDLFAQAADASDADLPDIADQLTQIATDWSAYPDSVDELGDVPAGAEDLADAYADFADNVGTTGEQWLVWLGADQGSTEETDASDAWQAAYADAQDGVATVQDEIDAIGTGSSNNDDPTPDATEEGGTGTSGDVDGYVSDVQDELDSVTKSFDRFDEILATYSDATAADQDDMAAELTEIVAGWSDYEATAADLGDAPEGGEDVQAAYEQYASDVAATGDAFTEYLGTEQDSPEEADALDAFQEARGNVDTSAQDLQDAIDAVTGGQVRSFPVVRSDTLAEIKLAA